MYDAVTNVHEQRGSLSRHDDRRRSSRRPRPEAESRLERKQRTRSALIEAALALLEDRAFGSLSLREVTRAAGIAPAAFYRHFQDMDELGFALVDESFRRLRGMLRSARERAGYGDAIRSSVALLARHVEENRTYFRFIARERSTGVPAIRRAIRGEIRLFTSDLATDLARFPVLCTWSSEDLQMVAALMVNTMVATVEELLEVPPEDLVGVQEVLRTAERQLRLVLVAIPRWISTPPQPVASPQPVTSAQPVASAQPGDAALGVAEPAT